MLTQHNNNYTHATKSKFLDELIHEVKPSHIGATVFKGLLLRGFVTTEYVAILSLCSVTLL